MQHIFLVLSLVFTTTLSAQEAVDLGAGATFRGLDKVDGTVADFELNPGQIHQIGRLSVSLQECRYPAGNPAGDAFAHLTINEIDRDDPVFSGWMIASSPALNALEHPRYDIWVLRCKTG